MSKQLVFVEFDGQNIIRIIRKHIDVFKLPPERVQQVAKSVAVGEIRRQVVARANGECENCGKRILGGTGHMHEKLAKGKRGEDGDFGEVSVDNCCYLCYDCHINGEHGDRRFQSAKLL
jgi:hypothetical protein